MEERRGSEVTFSFLREQDLKSTLVFTLTYNGLSDISGQRRHFVAQL